MQKPKDQTMLEMTPKYTQSPYLCRTFIRGVWLSWQQQTHTAQHAPRSMHHGFPHKDWHHSCACTTGLSISAGGTLRNRVEESLRTGDSDWLKWHMLLHNLHEHAYCNIILTNEMCHNMKESFLNPTDLTVEFIKYMLLSGHRCLGLFLHTQVRTSKQRDMCTQHKHGRQWVELVNSNSIFLNAPGGWKKSSTN